MDLSSLDWVKYASAQEWDVTRGTLPLARYDIMLSQCAVCFFPSANCPRHL